MSRILFMISTLKGGGAEKILVDLLNQIEFEDVQIDLLVLFNEGPHFTSIPEHVFVQTIWSKQIRGNSHLMKLFSKERLSRQIIREDYNLIISFLEGPTTRIVAGCSSAETSLVNWVHSEFHELRELSNSYRSKKELVESYLAYDHTVFVSETARQSFLKLIPLDVNKTSVLYNPLDLVKCGDYPQKTQLDERLTFVTAGRLSYQKGYDRLLRVVDRLVNQDGFDFQLEILGVGEQLDTLKKMQKKYGLEKHVHFLGYQKNPYPKLAAADLFIASSRFEGYSTVVTEATVLGVPVVATNCSGMEEILEDTGWIVDNSEEGLYQKLKQILATPSKILDMRQKSQKRGLELATKDYVGPIRSFIQENVQKSVGREYA